MRYSRVLLPTLKQVTADTKNPSHVLLLRAGYIRPVAAGIFSLLPLGFRVLERIKIIVREELTRIGATEVLLPMIHPAPLWQESGRWSLYGPELLRFQDRKGFDFALSATAEEVMVALVRDDVNSYRKLPLHLYQIQDKFRDEFRPRAGLLRGREFVMKDGYSFHATAADALREYKAVYDAYTRIFTRCGLDFRAVEADTGSIGGNQSHEFQVLANTGEDRLVSCDHCDYAANVEKALLAAPPVAPVTVPAEPQQRATPDCRSIAEVARALHIPESQLIKTLLYRADTQVVAVLIRGDRELNECKLKVLLKADEVTPLSPEHILQLTGAEAGSLGPVGLSVPVYADWEVAAMPTVVAGANQTGMHTIGLQPGVHFHPQYVDLRIAQAGDACGSCQQGRYLTHKGIEVGHVFYLGTKYSTPLKCEFLDIDGQRKPMEMGTYGIGITRVMAAAVEQRHDEKGIVWPVALAPFQVVVTTAGVDPAVQTAAESLYNQLQQARLDVLYDDRDERPGVKFADAELIGIPVRITVGKRFLTDQTVEIVFRDARWGAPTVSTPAQALSLVIDFVTSHMQASL